MLKLVTDQDAVEHDGREDGPPGVDLDELCRVAAREMLAVALEAERRAWLEDHGHLLDGDGKRLVVGNGYLPQRTIVTGVGEVAAARRGRTTDGPSPNGSGPARRSCRPTCAGHRR